MVLLKEKINSNDFFAENLIRTNTIYFLICMALASMPHTIHTYNGTWQKLIPKKNGKRIS
jgi:hypothetical protein